MEEFVSVLRFDRSSVAQWRHRSLGPGTLASRGKNSLSREELGRACIQGES